jgi:ketosteroid isomerase-like protein
MAKGRAAIEAYYKGFFQQVMMHGMTITPSETRVMGDRAYDAGTYKQQIMMMNGGNGGVIDDHGKYIVLLKKEGGAWVITHAIYNSDLPVAPPKK